MQNRFTEVQSLHRALDILECIGNSSKPAQLKTIAQAANLPKSTVYRLLRNLETRGYVACDNQGVYRLGLKLLILSQRVDQSFELKQLVRPFLVQLNGATKETVFLGIMDNNKVLYVDSVESPHHVRLVAKPGSTNLLHCTSLGKALLFAHSDESIRDIFATQGMEARTAYTICDPDVFLQEISQARKSGFVLDDRESAEDCRCVGAPIYNHKRQVVAAISISGPAARFTREVIDQNAVSELLAVTGQISALLGRL